MVRSFRQVGRRRCRGWSTAPLAEESVVRTFEKYLAYRVEDTRRHAHEVDLELLQAPLDGYAEGLTGGAPPEAQ
jgi:hypothetical protein